MSARPFAVYAIGSDPYGWSATSPPDPGIEYRRWLTNQPGFESAEFLRSGQITRVTDYLVRETASAEKMLADGLPSNFWEDEDGDDEDPGWTDEDIKALSGSDVAYNTARPQLEVVSTANPKELDDIYTPSSKTRIDALINNATEQYLKENTQLLICKLAERLLQLDYGVDLTVFIQGLTPILNAWIHDKLADSDLDGGTHSQDTVHEIFQELKTIFEEDVKFPVNYVGTEKVRVSPDFWFIPVMRDKKSNLPMWVRQSWLKWAFLRNRSAWGITLKHSTGFVYVLLDNRSGVPFLRFDVRNKAIAEPTWDRKGRKGKHKPSYIQRMLETHPARQQRLLLMQNPPPPGGLEPGPSRTRMNPLLENIGYPRIDEIEENSHHYGDWIE